MTFSKIFLLLNDIRIHNLYDLMFPRQLNVMFLEVWNSIPLNFMKNFTFIVPEITFMFHMSVFLLVLIVLGNREIEDG